MDRRVYGVRLLVTGGPIWDDEETKVVGTWLLAFPRLHPITKSFDVFAPVLAELLPEGACMYVAGKEKYLKRYGSKKFDIPRIQTGVVFEEGSVAMEVFKLKGKVTRELDASTYGFPVMTAAYPLLIFHEEVADETA